MHNEPHASFEFDAQGIELEGESLVLDCNGKFRQCKVDSALLSGYLVKLIWVATPPARANQLPGAFEFGLLCTIFE